MPILPNSVQVPDQVYWIIGVIVFMNIGTVVSLWIASFKGIWWLSKLDSRVKQNTEDIDAAHTKLRSIERGI